MPAQVENKLFLFLRAAGSIPPEMFHYFWAAETGMNYVAALAGRGVTRMVYNPVLEMNYRPGTNAGNHVWTGLAEFWFESGDMPFELATQRDLLNQLRGVHGRLIAEQTALPVRQILMYDNLDNPDPLKVTSFFRRSLPVSRADSHAHWLGPHAELGLQLKADDVVRKYYQNHTMLDYANPDAAYDYDGSSTVYFDTLDGAAHIYRNPTLQEITTADEIHMGVTPADVVSMLTREIPVFQK